MKSAGDMGERFPPRLRGWGLDLHLQRPCNGPLGSGGAGLNSTLAAGDDEWKAMQSWILAAAQAKPRGSIGAVLGR